MANFTEDIEGSRPKKLNAVNEDQRNKASPESNYGKRHREIVNSRSL